MSAASSAAVPAIEIRGLVKRYGAVEALKGLDFTIQRGEIFGLLGPNGAGKTTLFSILATLRTPTAGVARVLGRDVTTERDAVRRAMGIVFQEPAIEQRLTGRDNLLLMGLFFGLSRAKARARAVELLDHLGLTESADRPARTLSGGQRRKLELARALVTDPDILFLDEATLGLDVDARRVFWAEVRAIAATGRTVFFTTHYMEEAEIADRIALIDSGRIVALDTPRALKARVGGGIIRLQTDDDAQARAWLDGEGLRAHRRDAGAHAGRPRSRGGPAGHPPPPAGQGAPRGGARAEPGGRVSPADGQGTGRGGRRPGAAAGRAQAMIRGIYAIVVLDLKRAWLDRARLVTGLIQPLLYLFVLGAGLGAASRMGTAVYERDIFPGVMGLSLLFTAVFMAISIVFDRQIGFLKAVLVSPIPRPAIALGKITSGALQALAQGLILLPFAPLAGVHLTVLTTLAMLGAMVLAAMTFSAIGVAVASRFTSTTVFPIISNTLILPLYFLSGALYPLKSAPAAMQLAAHFDPVAYAVDLMRGALLGTFFFPPALSILALLAVIAALAAASVRVFNRGEDDSVLGAVNLRWRQVERPLATALT